MTRMVAILTVSKGLEHAASEQPSLLLLSFGVGKRFKRASWK